MFIATLPPDRYGQAVALWRSTGLTRPWNDPDADLERALDGPSSTVLAATEAGRHVGTLMVGHDGHRGWVYYLAVDPQARNFGVGRELVRAATPPEEGRPRPWTARTPAPGTLTPWGTLKADPSRLESALLR